jgi:hypothetical protein
MPDDFINDTTQELDKEMCAQLEVELGVWAYLMVQYNLKPGLRKFGEKGEKAAVSSEIADSIICDGHVDAHGGSEAVSGTQDASTLVACLSQRKAHGGYQWMGQHKRSATTCVHPEGICGVTYHIDRINVHHGYFSSEGETKGTML